MRSQHSVFFPACTCVLLLMVNRSFLCLDKINCTCVLVFLSFLLHNCYISRNSLFLFRSVQKEQESDAFVIRISRLKNELSVALDFITIRLVWVRETLASCWQPLAHYEEPISFGVWVW